MRSATHVDTEQRSRLLALLALMFVAEAPEAGLSGARGSAKVEGRPRAPLGI